MPPTFLAALILPGAVGICLTLVLGGPRWAPSAWGRALTGFHYDSWGALQAAVGAAAPLSPRALTVHFALIVRGEVQATEGGVVVGAGIPLVFQGVETSPPAAVVTAFPIGWALGVGVTFMFQGSVTGVNIHRLRALSGLWPPNHGRTRLLCKSPRHSGSLCQGAQRAEAQEQEGHSRSHVGQ